MNFINRFTQQSARWVGLCVLVLTLSCSSDEVGQQVECKNNSDCISPQVCNVIQGLCAHVREEPSRPNNPVELPGDGANPGNSEAEDIGIGADSGSSEVDATNSGFDTDSNQEEDTQELDAPEPEETMCAAISQACDLSRPIQGDFVCVESSESGSTCLKRCVKADHPSTCEDGFYCREHTVNGTFVLGCAAGGCVSNRDCDHVGAEGGNCIDQGKGYKECVEAGGILEGQACQGGGADNCADGTRCRVTDRGANTGICSRLCDPWSPELTCPNSSYCEPFNATQGMCNSNVVTNAVRYYYDACRPVGSMCSDSAKCVGFTDNSTHCVPYCRVGQNDCSGLRKPWGGGFFDSSSPTSCQPRDFPDTEQLGYCL